MGADIIRWRRFVILALLLALALGCADAPPVAHGVRPSDAEPASSIADEGRLLDINRATASELEALPGIGPVLSERIVEGRPYEAIEDLLRVSGIGPARFEAIEGLVTVGPLDDLPAPAVPLEPTPDETGPHVYAGIPRANGYPYEITVLRNTGYKVGYCEERRNPVWVSYRVFHVEDPESHPRPSRFRIDDRTESRVSHDCYTHSGFDRGHMAPNYAIVTRYGIEAQRETFLMSNISPQTPTLNRQTWQRLEAQIANAYAERYGQVWVKIGPIFGTPGEWLDSGVKIPDRFYAIIVKERDGEPRALAFIIPQDVQGDEDLAGFLTSINAIENMTGLDFLHELDDALEEHLESGVAAAPW